MGIKFGQNSKLQFVPSKPQIWHPVPSQGSKSFVQYLEASNYGPLLPKMNEKVHVFTKIDFDIPYLASVNSPMCTVGKEHPIFKFSKKKSLERILPKQIKTSPFKL